MLAGGVGLWTGVKDTGVKGTGVAGASDCVAASFAGESGGGGWLDSGELVASGKGFKEEAIGGSAAGGTDDWLLAEVAGAPQLLQNALPGVIGCPQFTQNFGAGLAGWLCGAPQELQNRTPPGIAAPQWLHVVLMLSCPFRSPNRSMDLVPWAISFSARGGMQDVSRCCRGGTS
jgi:hypothetical protein